MELTDEQKRFIEETIQNPNGTYACTAAAGSGKSFTIFKAIDYIKEHEPYAKILYLVFNKSNQLEAQQKLMKYASWQNVVEVKTAHSFAHYKWMQVFGPFTAINSLQWPIIRNIIQGKNVYDPEIRYSKKAPFIWLHDKYCSSLLPLDAFIESMRAHWEDDYDGPDKPKDCTILGPKGRQKEIYGIQVDAYSVVTRAHLQYFKDIIEEHIKQKLFTHSMYLKYAAMSKKTGGSQYDYVFFDEAQDANKMMLELLKKQDVRKTYFIGDERQSIYDFDGSNVNVFRKLNFDKEYTLTRSFRFGEAIARLARRITNIDTDFAITGTEQTHETNPNSKALLFRTNAKLFEVALDLAYTAKINGKKLKIDFMTRLGEDDNMFLEIMAFLGLYYKHTNYSYYCSNVDEFPKELPSSLTQFNKRLEEDNMSTFLDIYNEQYDALSDDIHGIFEYARKEKDFIAKYKALRECLMRQDYDELIVMITMHRSKGLEWDNVIIAEPTLLYYKDKDGNIRKNQKHIQEKNLMYVAVTRARKTLNATMFLDDLEHESPSLFENETMLVKEGKTIEPASIQGDTNG